MTKTGSTLWERGLHEWGTSARPLEPSPNGSLWMGSIRSSSRTSGVSFSCGPRGGSLFAPLGLRFGKRGESLSAVPVIQILDVRPPNSFQLDPPEGLLYFPDYVDGGGWSVQLALSNVDPTAAAAVVVTAYDQEGQPDPELFDSEATFEIPSRGSRVLRSAGAGSIRRGWIQVQSQAASVRGLLTYRHGKTGIEVGVEPVPLRDHFALFVEESTDIGTGLAIFKPDAAPEIEFQIRNQAGLDPIGEVLSWGNFQQRAQTIPEWFERVNPEILKDFQGLLYLRAGDGSSFAPLGLRFGKRRGSLSAVPAIPILDEGPNLVPPTVSLSASPASIEWGRSATLRWSSTGAVSATLTPGIGAVPTSGSHSVSPTRTTTYRITVRGGGGQTQTAMASAKVTVVISERAALMALYDLTGGPNWTSSENWLTGRPLGEWHGVEVDDHGRLISLRLVGNDLTGPIPVELGSLANLEVLNLYGNGLTGPIPAQLGSLANLEVLNLYGNDLTGPIPAQLGSLANLEVLYLHGNDLTGPIPVELGSLANLEVLDLYGNGLTGNDLTGPIPVEWPTRQWDPGATRLAGQPGSPKSPRQ